MSKETSKRGDFLEIKVPENLTGLLHNYQGRVLADDSLSDMDVLLLSIYLLDTQRKGQANTYEETRRLFASLGRKDQQYRVVVHRAKKSGLIDTNKANQMLFLIKGLKHLRKIIGQIGKSPVYIIKSGESFKAIKLLEEFLAQEVKGGEVLLCDSHISHVTLFPFDALKGKLNSLKILTSNIYDKAKLEEYKKRMTKELGASIEIKENRKIHDRYIISGDKCWHLGTSIKDIGNKDTLIKEISEITTSMKDLFDERWGE